MGESSGWKGNRLWKIPLGSGIGVLHSYRLEWDNVLPSQ